jgi:hypothetical protein
VSDDDMPDEPNDFDDEDLDPLDVHEAELIERDLADLAEFEAAFEPEGYRGVSVWCADCVEEHYYPWAMLRENLTLLLETGETPVHEPAFAPEPARYINWEYARGYVDALRDAGVNDRIILSTCTRCTLELEGSLAQANFCPRCGNPLLRQRLVAALTDRGISLDDAEEIVRSAGLPG